jgi:hypothetical protein
VAGGCSNTVGDAHKYQHCQVSIHPFCGLGFETEGYGQSVTCKVCQQTNGVLAGNAAGEGSKMDEGAVQRQLPVARRARRQRGWTISLPRPAAGGRAGVRAVGRP